MSRRHRPSTYEQARINRVQRVLDHARKRTARRARSASFGLYLEADELARRIERKRDGMIYVASL